MSEFSKAPACTERGCRYEASGYSRCSQGCVEAGRGFTPYPPMTIPGIAAAQMQGHMMAARLVSSSDSGTGTEHHSAEGPREPPRPYVFASVRNPGREVGLLTDDERCYD